MAPRNVIKMSKLLLAEGVDALYFLSAPWLSDCIKQDYIHILLERMILLV